MKFKAVIFDKDGVIVDSEPLQYLAFKEVLAEYGHVYTEEDNKNLSLGKSSELTYTNIKQKYGIVDIETFKLRRRLRYRELAETKLRTRPGTLSLICQLHRKLPLAVASGSSEKLLINDLKKVRVFRYFKIIVSGEFYKSKPDPEIFLVTAQKLEILPRECIVIEDSQAGVEAAKSAGMYCIAIPNSFTSHQDFSRADYVVHTFLNIRSIINPLINDNKHNEKT